MRKHSLFPVATSLLALTVVLSGCSATQNVFHPRAPVTAEAGADANYQAALKLGDKARADRKLDQAASQYARAARWMPDQTQPLIRLSDVLWEMKNPAEAVKVLLRAREIEPDNTLILRNLGRAYVALNQPDPAQEAYKAALERDPNDVRLLNGLGVATDLAGKHEAAQDHYRAGLAIEPQNLEIQNNLAYSLVSSGKYQEAVDILEPLSQRADATARQRQNLALAYGLLGKEDEVRRVARADLTPAQIEKNIEIYKHLRVEPQRKDTLRTVGAPTQSGGGFVAGSAASGTASVAPASSSASVTAPSPAAAPAREEVVPLADMSAPDGASGPVALAPVTPEPISPSAADQPVVLGRLSDSSSPVKGVKGAGGVKPTAPVTTPAPASSGVLKAPDSAATGGGASLSVSGLGDNKIYLGSFPTEAAARDVWVKTWVKNSTLLSSMAASVEPQGSQVALYAVGASSPQQADSLCTSLRQNGVSCGVAR